MTGSNGASDGRRSWEDVFGLRVIARWGVTRTLRVIAFVALGVGMAWVLSEARPWSGPPVTWIHDVQYYYGAGERLNTGAQLYAYSPGDRRLDVDPFYFAGPFLYPPLLGVLWRPVALLLTFEIGVTLFWGIGLVVFLWTICWLLVRGGPLTAIGVLVLVVPLVWTAWSGNVSTVLTPLMIASWLLLLRGRDAAAGAVVGIAAVTKLTPAFLGWWLIVFHRCSAVRLAIVAAAIGLLMSLVGAGPGALFEYLRVSQVVAQNGGTLASITSILAGLGAGPDIRVLVAPVVAVIGIALIVLLRDRPRAAWAVAICTGVFGSPVFNLTNVSLLLAAFVALDRSFGALPATWPGAWRERESAPPVDRTASDATLTT